MRPGPATLAALLSRTFLTAVFRQGERSSRNCTPKSAVHRRSLRLALQGSDSAFPSPLEEGFLRRPQSPGAGTLDMCRISPGDSLSRNHRQR
jgi:hypothetical protein